MEVGAGYRPGLESVLWIAGTLESVEKMLIM
jgi:hypothetical protein